MKFFKLGLLTLLISLFILGSCKNPDSIGLGVDPSKALQGSLIDTATIKTVTALDDSVLTSGTSSTDTIVPIAYFKDPVFGTTEANLAASLSLPGDIAFSTPTDPVIIDSAVLVLNYMKGFYGDITTNYNINVYQLAEPILGKSYYNNKSWSFSTPAIGSKTFVPHPNDSLKIKAIVTGGPDTLIKVQPQLRIPISAAFIKNSLFNGSASTLGTNTIFQNSVKGLYVSVNTTPLTATHPGGNLFFSVSTSSRIDVYYRVIHPSASPDSLVATMPVGEYHAVQIKHDYTVNADISNQILPANANGSFPTVYLQGMGGLRNKLSFPYLTNARLLHDLRKSSFATNPAVDTLGITDISINQAELRVTPVASSGIPFPALRRLTLYRLDIAHQRTLVPDAYSADPRYLGVGSFGGFFDTYHQSYSFIITGYVNDLLKGKLIDYGTYLAPADSTGLYTGSATVNIGSAINFTGRSVLGGNKTSAYKMKLNILYNKVTK